VKKIETVVIIDSGIECINSDIIGGISIALDNDVVVFEDTYTDNVGHGTAIYNIIKNNCSDVNFFIVKIFDDTFTTNQRLLLSALKYIYDNVDCRFVIISSGTIIYNNVIQISNIIDNLYYQKNVFIISAFNNDEALSFPASHNNVIGVDSSDKISPAENYYIVKGSPINILSSKRMHRL